MTTPNNERREEIARIICSAPFPKPRAWTRALDKADEVMALPPLPPRGEEPVVWRRRLKDTDGAWSMTDDPEDAKFYAASGRYDIEALGPIAPPSPTNLQKVQSAPASQASAEPCFECGSTERIGTACKPCNPELAPAEAQARVEERARELFDAWKNEHGLVCDARPETGHKPHRNDKDVFCEACGETLSAQQVRSIGRMKTDDQIAALLSGSTPKPARDR